MSSPFVIQTLQFNQSAINTELVTVSITDSKFGILNLQAISSPLNETSQEFVFTVDCSGSMSDGCADGRTKMQHIVHTIKNMLLYFKENSIKAFVTINAFDDKNYNIVKRTNITDENYSAIISSVDKIVPRTNTNIEKALEYARENISQIKTEFPENNISHILMTDGEATTGNRDHEFLSALVDTTVTNIFIGFGTEHDTTLLNRLGSCGAKSGYYFIDKLENCGIVYGEVLHSILYKLLFDVNISVQNGLIYDFKNNDWVSSLFIGEIVSENNKFYHIASQNPTECIISFTGKNISDLTELAFTITGEQTDTDLTKFIYRQRTLQHLFTVNDYLKRKNSINNSYDNNYKYNNNLFIFPIQPENEALKEERKTIKASLLEFINEMKQFMTDKQLTDDAFMKNLCDDIYICYKTFETKFGAMYVGARQTSQGTQRAYTVSHTPSDDNNKFTLNDFIGYDTNISQNYLTPRINRTNNCFNCTNLPSSFDDVMLNDTSILQHELSNFDEAPYLTPTSNRLIREISSNTSAQEETQDP